MMFTELVTPRMYLTFMELVYFVFDVYGTCDVGMGSCLDPL